jgi:phosphatidylserine/phosphatidylglycerophosphate/cardiolipin synthase-like enzyme
VICVDRRAQSRVTAAFVLVLIIGGIMGAAIVGPMLAPTQTLEKTYERTIVYTRELTVTETAVRASTTTATVTETTPLTHTSEKTVTETMTALTTLYGTTTVERTVYVNYFNTSWCNVTTTTVTLTSTIYNATQTVTQTVTSTTTYTTTVTQTAQQVRKVCFSRVSDCSSIIINLINRANRSIHVMVYSFTYDPLADALIMAHKRNVSVTVIIERQQANVTGSVYYKLLNAGVDVRLDSNPYLMHHKVAIIDGWIVVTGSFNWSRSAEERNDENIVVIYDEAVAGMYEQEFQRILAST